MILRQRKSAARTSNVAEASTVRDLRLTMLFLFSGMHPDGFFEEGEDEEESDIAEGRPVTVRHATQLVGPGHGTRPPSVLNDLFKEGGVDVPPAKAPADLGDNLLDTGHYDDGHAFGWKSAGTKPALGDWLHLSANNAPYEELVEQIERDIHADLDDDGEIGGSGKAGGTIETEVGPPTTK